MQLAIPSPPPGGISPIPPAKSSKPLRAGFRATTPRPLSTVILAIGVSYQPSDAVHLLHLLRLLERIEVNRPAAECLDLRRWLLQHRQPGSL
jgi:hypothetical protein